MYTRALFIAVSVTALLSPPEVQARTATLAEREACQAAIRKRMDDIDARMRQPYGVREGERLRDKRDQLEKALEKCRVKQ